MLDYHLVSKQSRNHWRENTLQDHFLFLGKRIVIGSCRGLIPLRNIQTRHGVKQIELIWFTKTDEDCIEIGQFSTLCIQSSAREKRTYCTANLRKNQQQLMAVAGLSITR